MAERDRFERRAAVRRYTRAAVQERIWGNVDLAMRFEAKTDRLILAAPAEERDDLEELAGDVEERTMADMSRADS